MPNIEDLMRQAMADGKFDSLPGKGKPLRLDDANPYADPDWELAYKMLKDAGYSLPWIEELREIEADLADARKELQVACDMLQSAQSDPQRSSIAASDWERSQSDFKEKLLALNKRIRAFNLQVPSARFQRPVLNFDAELRKISSQGTQK